MRLVIFGNSGAGKTTLARATAARRAIAHLDLDSLAWDPGPRRRPLQTSRVEIDAFLERHPDWVIEGSYGDLVDLVLPYATRVVFLNPGVEACVKHCRHRPWEPDKYSSPGAQDANLEFLLRWVREYETRDDEFSLSRHRALFESFAGEKLEISAPDAVPPEGL